MNEERFIEAVTQVMSDKSPFTTTIEIKEAWLIVTCLQLGIRHPNIGSAQKRLFEQVARQFQSAIVALHPEANPLLNMGWDERFDVEEEPLSPDMNSPEPLQPVNNCWTVYADGATEDSPALAQLGRPQDWGDPRWMYHVYTLEALGYRHTVHCWIDVQMKDHEHLQLFMPLVAQIMLPGVDVKLSGRDYLKEDDFWRDEWGVMPPYVEVDEGDWNY